MIKWALIIFISSGTQWSPISKMNLFVNNIIIVTSLSLSNHLLKPLQINGVLQNTFIKQEKRTKADILKGQM